MTQLLCACVRMAGRRGGYGRGYSSGRQDGRRYDRRDEAPSLKRYRVSLI